MASVRVSGSSTSLGLWLEGLTFTNDNSTSGEISRSPQDSSRPPAQNKAKLDMRGPDPKTVGLVFSSFDFTIEDCDFSGIDRETASITISESVVLFWKRTRVHWSLGCCRGSQNINSASAGLGIHRGTWRIERDPPPP
jgi:hypothetical protein